MDTPPITIDRPADMIPQIGESHPPSHPPQVQFGGVRRVTGVSPSGRDMWVVTLELGSGWRLAPRGTKLFQLEDHSQAAVRALALEVRDFINWANISQMAFRRRVVAGPIQSSVWVWKSETVCQMIARCKTELFSNSEISGWVRTSNVLFPAPDSQLTSLQKDQQYRAIETALFYAEVLNRRGR